MRNMFSIILGLISLNLILKSIKIIKEEGTRTFLLKLERYIKSKSTNRRKEKSFKRYKGLKGFVNTNKRLSKNWYKTNGKKVAIIIPSFHHTKNIKNCLKSLKKTVPKKLADILILYDSNADPRQRIFLESINNHNIKVLFSENNGGISNAINKGLNLINKLDVVLMNSYIEAKSGWLEALQYAAYSNKKNGIVVPKLLYPNRKIHSGGLYRCLSEPKQFGYYYRFQPDSLPVSNITNKIIATTSCMYIKNQVLHDIGTFDEKYEFSFEDIDFCLRAWNHGYHIEYCPFSELIHYASVTRNSDDFKKRIYRSKIYFWNKWNDWLDNRNVKSNNGKLNIIYVLELTGVGGGTRIVFEHMNRLQEAGMHVELYSLEDRPEWFPLKVPVKTFTNYDDLIAALKNQEAIKVATWWNTSEPVWISSVNKGIPVYLVQDIESSYYKDDIIMKYNVLAKYRKKFRYLTTSNWNNNQLKKLGINSTIVSCGIDRSKFKPLKVDRLSNILITAGRSHYLKNLQYTLDAWSQIKVNQPTLWMYGIEPELGKKINNCKYIYKPSDEKINELLNKATVCILTSSHEGFALTILEAMAAGTPVICTDADGNRDFCTDGKNCLMVKQDDVRELKRIIEYLFNNYELQNQLREEGFKTAAQYDWKKVIPKLVDFYKSVADYNTK